MAKQPKVAKEVMQQRWLRDFTSQQQVYVPEALAKPSRMCEGFDLREDGTYCQISSGSSDATVEADGKWVLDDDGLLTLSPDKASGTERKIRIVAAEQDKLLVEE